MRKGLLFTCVCLTLFALQTGALFTRAASAQDTPEEKKRRLIGEIKVETEERKKGPHEEGRDKTIAYFGEVAALIPTLASTGSGQVRTLDKEPRAVDYLTALYLYCTIQNGACPLVLDAIFESDLINARLNGPSDCPGMRAFWKRWLENGFEERMKYSISTGRMDTFNNFTSKQRPRYLNCAATLKGELQGADSHADYFRARYGKDSPQGAAPGKVAKLTELIKVKQINVFTAVGVKH